MENYPSTQLSALAAAVFSGFAAAVLYDLLRSVRLRRRRSHGLTHVADGFFVLFLGILCLNVTLRIGGGELRLYLAAGLAGGALLWFALPSGLLRPVWDWWLDTLREFLHLLWRPLAFALRLGQKVAIRIKKGFLFCRKYATMKLRRWQILWFRRRRKEGVSMAKSTRRRRRVSPIIWLIIAALVILLSVQIVQVYTRYQSLQAEESALSEQESALQQENDALRADLGKKDDPTFWEQLARKFADMVKQGERIFIDPNY